jgi:hypothetical protein
MEKLFKVEFSISVATNRRDGGPSAGEVMEALSKKLHGRQVPSVVTIDHPILTGDGWNCVALNGLISDE